MAQDTSAEGLEKAIETSDTSVNGSESAVPKTEEIAPHANTGYHNAELDFDTGFKAWSQVLGSFFLFFNSWGLINTFGAFQTYYEDQILSHESASTIAWIGSIESFLLMFIGVVAGPLFDAGFLSVMLAFGSFMVVFGYMMTSLASEYYQVMLAQGICVGIGAGFLFVPSVAILPQYFRKRRALANGIAASGSSFGGVIYPIMFDQLQRQVGFPWATRAIAFVALGTCTFSCLILRARFLPTERRDLIQLSAFKEVPYTLFCFGMFFGFLGFYNFLIYVQPWAIQNGVVNANLGFYLVSILNAASIFGRITPNLIADYTGPINILLPAAGLTALMAFCWIAVNSAAGIIVLAALYGFFSGGFVSLPPVVMMAITKDFRDLGTRLGMCFSISSLALLVGTPIGGAILSAGNSYLGVQLFCGACLATCAAFMVVIRFIRVGWKLTART
ncbi:MFS monocarboxylate transporter, putative [Talaromyces stipitatus ATCC 10500]|uniref:MFS monocarboxylate transporter, putative n=1 Tax=Talaromyces stipitatus (strain ATCC 10500 / CBS 375.48 / QM 6759 / NRRL 1006) TaxID=441959 RepID=B8MH47_TALSN|nr:MFS monocarboxylate transporter, putative [Talaromyces stipitatus ATCC 10500]EED16861.1 MFS monocarboxylate transporter, putative [Talaromyces stipitatus ATCC 10500]